MDSGGGFPGGAQSGMPVEPPVEPITDIGRPGGFTPPMPMPPVEVPPAPILNDPFRGPVEVPSIPGVQPEDLNPVLPEVINIDQVPFPVPDFSDREGPMGIVGPSPKRSPFMPLPPARTMPVPPAPIMPDKMPSPINQIIGDVKPIRPRPPVSLPLPVQDLGPIGSMSGMPGMGRGLFGR